MPARYGWLLFRLSELCQPLQKHVVMVFVEVTQVSCIYYGDSFLARLSALLIDLAKLVQCSIHCCNVKLEG
jgi:hypothetical protein